MTTLIAPFDVQDPRFYLLECAIHGAPWSRAAFTGCAGKLYRSRALWVDGEAIGFTITHLVAGELTLMNIAVHPDKQGKGYGALLLQDLIDFASSGPWPYKAGKPRHYPIFLEVREHNHSAIALYRKYGFQDIGRRPNYYPPIPPATHKETAIVMRWTNKKRAAGS